MVDFASLSTEELDALLRDAIGRRLDGRTDAECTRAAADLFTVLQEIRRRNASRPATSTVVRAVPSGWP
jgi:hypothetical protein